MLYLKKYISVKLQDLTYAEMTDFKNNLIQSLSGKSNIWVDYDDFKVQQVYEEYSGNDIDGYTIPFYKMEPKVEDLHTCCVMLQKAASQKYEKWLDGPVSRREFYNVKSRK